MVERPLQVTLRDANAENAVIAKAELTLVPLLHESTEVGDEWGIWWEGENSLVSLKKSVFVSSACYYFSIFFNS